MTVEESDASPCILCPGQGAQTIGMGKAWCERSTAARATFDEADDILADDLGTPLSEICFNGPSDRLNRTDVAQPAIYACSIACLRGMVEHDGPMEPAAAAGLSLGEYTALHIAGVFDFGDGLRLVAKRGRLMQEAAQQCDSGMVALIGADDEQAASICRQAAQGEVLVCANFNAPGQIVLSGHRTACRRAVGVAEGVGLRARELAVAGAFHSPLMQPAADGMTEALDGATLGPLALPVWSNVTAQPHDSQDPELLKRRLVEQIVSPVRWSQTCQNLVERAPGGTMGYHEVAPGSVLRGLMRRIDRTVKVTSHDQP